MPPRRCVRETEPCDSEKSLKGARRARFNAPPTHEGYRGADRDRTDDLRLAKPALSQLSYSPGGGSRWARAELNCRPHAYQACALTT